MEVTKCDLHLMATGSNGRAERLIDLIWSRNVYAGFSSPLLYSLKQEYGEINEPSYHQQSLSAEDAESSTDDPCRRPGIEHL